jgi:hypothetical protein
MYQRDVVLFVCARRDQHKQMILLLKIHKV